MNKNGNPERDQLREFIKPDHIENAPEGFTEKVMSEISLETCNKASVSHPTGYIVPIVAAVIITVLTIAAIFINSGDTSFKLPWTLDISLPAINFNKFLNFSLPAVIGYIIIGMLLLGVFDKVLFSLFHHGKRANT
jgi:hypothetical protein